MKHKTEQLFIISTRMESTFLQHICMEWNCFIILFIIATIFYFSFPCMNMQTENRCKESKYAMQHTCAGPSPKLAQGWRSEVA
jgi:Na+/H+ antiporter NhaC